MGNHGHQEILVNIQCGETTHAFWQVGTRTIGGMFNAMNQAVLNMSYVKLKVIKCLIPFQYGVHIASLKYDITKTSGLVQVWWVGKSNSNVCFSFCPLFYCYKIAGKLSTRPIWFRCLFPGCGHSCLKSSISNSWIHCSLFVYYVKNIKMFLGFP